MFTCVIVSKIIFMFVIKIYLGDRGGEKYSSGDHEPEDEAFIVFPLGGLTTS